MIVKAKSKKYINGSLREVGEVFKVFDKQGRQLVERGFADEVRLHPKFRQEKPEYIPVNGLIFKQNGPWIEVWENDTKIEQIRKSEAKEKYPDKFKESKVITK